MVVRTCGVSIVQCDGEGEATCKAYRALAWICFVIYPVGVPCFFALVLHQNYDTLFDAACMNRGHLQGWQTPRDSAIAFAADRPAGRIVPETCWMPTLRQLRRLGSYIRFLAGKRLPCLMIVLALLCGLSD